MSNKTELDRIAALLTGKEGNGKSIFPILKAIADSLEGDDVTGAWGNGQVALESVEMSGASITADSVSGHVDGIGRMFALTFSITGTVAESTADATTIHFEATMPRDIPEDFSAVGQGYAHTTDGAGGYLPCIVTIGPSSAGGATMDVHMVFANEVPNGEYSFVGYVMAMLPIAE